MDAPRRGRDENEGKRSKESADLNGRLIEGGCSIRLARLLLQHEAKGLSTQKIAFSLFAPHLFHPRRALIVLQKELLDAAAEIASTAVVVVIVAIVVREKAALRQWLVGALQGR